MIKPGGIMKVRKQLFLVFITLSFILNYILFIPNVSAPPPPSPDHFIAEIFPNSTAPLQLSYTNTIITFNNVDLSDKIDVSFDATYTIYNQEKTTTLTIIQPFSLAINTSNVIFEVLANNTPISHDLISISPWDESIAAIDIQLALIFDERYPISLIRSNITLRNNSMSIIRYRYSFSIYNPYDIMNIFYMVYHIGTSEAWMGNTTGRVELKAYGSQPQFSMVYIRSAPCQVVDIIGGRSCIYEWNNTISPLMDIGASFSRGSSPFVEMMEILAFILPISMTFVAIIIYALFRNRKLVSTNSKKKF